jgi:hypothetical protein
MTSMLSACYDASDAEGQQRKSEKSGSQDKFR